MKLPLESHDDALERIRRVQRLAYECAESVAAELDEGITEREAAGRMRTWLTERGVSEWFHVPFVWFGDRTAFRGFRIPLQFFPTDRRLEAGMPFILDCAPVFDGGTADIGYTGSLGPNRIVDQLLDDLVVLRRSILDLVRERRPLAEIYADVDRQISKMGYTNRHRAYPYRVIAHYVPQTAPGRNDRILAGFGLGYLRSLTRANLRSGHDGWSLLWSGGRHSRHEPVPGLWAVEPHIGFRGVGAKFEEILVVTDDDAYWLDDDVPHVRRQAAPADDRVATVA